MGIIPSNLTIPTGGIIACCQGSMIDIGPLAGLSTEASTFTMAEPAGRLIFYNNGGGGGSIKVSNKVTTLRGTLVRLREDGVEENSVVVPYFIIVAGARPYFERGIKQGNDAMERVKRMLDDIERHGTYEDVLKFSLVVALADHIAGQFIAQLMSWSPGQLSEQANAHFLRMFGDEHPLPVEHGIFTELVKSYQQFNAGEKWAIGKVGGYLGDYLSKFRDKIKYSETETKFGPLALTPDDFLRIFKVAAEYMVEQYRGLKSYTARKEREKYTAFHLPNQRVLGFLGRDDIPHETKARLAMLYFFVGGDSACSAGNNDIAALFMNDDFAKSTAASAITKIDALYEKHVGDRIRGVAPKAAGTQAGAAAPVPIPKSSWRKASAIEISSMDYAGYRPEVSYSFLRNFDEYVWMVKTIKKPRTDISDEYLAPEVLRFRSRIVNIGRFLNDVRINRETRAMVLDLGIQNEEEKAKIISEMDKIINRARGNLKQLAVEIRQLYRRNVPYADALFAQLAAEKAAREDLEAVTERLLKKMEGEPQPVVQAWLKAQGKVPHTLRTTLFRTMQLAIIACGSDPNTYRPWMQKLASLSNNPQDWQWLRPEITEREPYELVWLLQDMTCPPAERVGMIYRKPQNLTELNPTLDNEIWGNFKSATAFLTNAEWEAMYDTMLEIGREAKDAARHFRSRNPGTPLSESIEERMAICGGRNFIHNAIRQISSILNGGLEKANLVRRLLRASVNDTDKLFSLMRMAAFAENGQHSAVQEVLDKINVMLDKKIDGDITGLAVRLAMPSDANEKQAAMAEYTTILNLADDGYFVTILSPDISTRRRTPDLTIQTADGKQRLPVEVKSRQRNGLDTVTAAVTDAAEQIAEKIRRSPDMQRGIVELYLIGNGNDHDAKMPEISHIQSLFRSAQPGSPLTKVEAVHLHFFQRGSWVEVQCYEIKN